MLNTLGSLSAAQSLGILDCVTYTAGVSGPQYIHLRSPWALTHVHWSPLQEVAGLSEFSTPGWLVLMFPRMPPCTLKIGLQSVTSIWIHWMP